MRKVYWLALSRIPVMLIGPEGAGAGAFWARVRKGMRVRRTRTRGVVEAMLMS